MEPRRGASLAGRAQVLNLWAILIVLPFALLGLGIAERHNPHARVVLLLLGGVTLAVRAMSRVGDACLRSGAVLHVWTPLGTAEVALASIRAAAVLGRAVGAGGFWVAALSRENRFARAWVLLDRGGGLSKHLIDRGIRVVGRSRVSPDDGEGDGFWNDPGERS